MPSAALSKRKSLKQLVEEQGVLAWGQNIPKGRKAPVKFDAMRKVRFLEAFAKCGRVYESARKAGVAYMTVKRHLEVDEELRNLLAVAQDVYNDHLEGECERRAVRGVTEPIFGTVYVDVPKANGEGTKRVKEHARVGTKRKYSDNLLKFMMQKHIPEYREQLDINARLQAVLVSGDMPKPAPEDEWADASNMNRTGAIDVEFDDVPDNRVTRG